MSSKMKRLSFSIFIISFLIFASCNSKKKSNEIASYSYEEETIEMSDKLKSLVPDWVVEGKICYGLIVQIDKDKNPVFGKPIKAKVVRIKKDAIIMKALENVSLIEVEDCSKMGLTKGETWNEEDGDFYLTKLDAVNALKKQKLYRDNDKVTVD